MPQRFFTLALICLLAAGCTVNPVTGGRDFITVSPAQELQMGEQAYVPSQQSQGGIYDVDPELNAYVRDVGMRLAAVAENPLPYEFVVLNNSVPNAWALPGGKIAINRGLLTELGSEAELAAVLGHEVVHAAARHSAQQMSRASISQVLVAATAVVAGDSSYGNLAVGGASLGAQLLSSTYGRGAELESDKYGMRYMSAVGYDTQGAISLQETFVRLNEGHDSDWVSGLFASHPPSQERVDANKSTAATLPEGGELGVERFRQKMQKTLDAKPAYEAYDKGRQALADENTEEALRLVNEALDAFPGEGHFHSLRGDIRLVEKNFEWAETNYTRSIEQRPDFFYAYMQRGIVRKELGNTDAARIDLERSLDFLETAPAHFALGEIKESSGSTQAAIEHYKVVAKAGGEYGKAATAALVRLELPVNPDAYIAHGCIADSNAKLVVQVRNDTGVVIEGVEVTVSYTDSVGREQHSVYAVRGQLRPGQVGSAATSLGPYSGGSCPVKVTAARIVE